MSPDSATVSVLTTLVSVTVFTIGFASIHFSNSRARAVDRHDQAADEIATLMRGQDPVSDAQLLRPYSVFDSIDLTWPTGITYANSVLLLLVFVLAAVALSQLGPVSFGIKGATPSFYPLVAAVLVEVGLVLFGAIYLIYLKRQLLQLKANTIAGRLHRAEQLLKGTSDPTLGPSPADTREALEQARRLFAEMPTAPWTARLVGFCHLARGDWQPAILAFDIAVDLARGFGNTTGNDSFWLSLVGKAAASTQLESGQFPEAVKVQCELMADALLSPAFDSRLAAQIGPSGVNGPLVWIGAAQELMKRDRFREALGAFEVLGVVGVDSSDTVARARIRDTGATLAGRLRDERQTFSAATLENLLETI